VEPERRLAHLRVKGRAEPLEDRAERELPPVARGVLARVVRVVLLDPVVAVAAARTRPRPGPRN